MRTTQTNVIHNSIPDVASGVGPVLSTDISVELGTDGLYHTIVSPSASEQTRKDLRACSAFSAEVPSEDTIAAELFRSAHIQSRPILGRYSALYAGYVTEPDFREHSSSGGLATWLAVELLRRGEIDGVIHMHKQQTLRDGDPLFSYGISRTVEEIRANAKTRYYPGELSHVLSEICGDGQRYLLIGIPSIIYEVRLLQRHSADFSRSIVYTIGLICGHQKSTHYAESLAWQAGIRSSQLKDIDFRVKSGNRRANEYWTAFKAKGTDDSVLRSQETLFGTDWGLGLFKAPFSDLTEDVMNETADIVLGDAWLEPYVADGLGANIVIVRNDHFRNVLTSAASERRVRLFDESPTRVLASQRALISHNIVERDARLSRWGNDMIERFPARWRSDHKIAFIRKQLQSERLKLSQESFAVFDKYYACDDLLGYLRDMKKISRRYRRLHQLDRLLRLTRMPIQEKLKKLKTKLSRHK